MDLGILTLPLTAAVLAFGLAVVTDTQAVHVERVSVPSEVVVATGYTPEVVSNRLVDDMHDIEKAAQSKVQARGIELQGEKGPLVVLADYFKVTPLIRVAQETAGLIPFRFSGEIVVRGKDLEFVLRGTDPNKTASYIVVRAPREQIGRLIHDAAYEATRVVDPYILAAYQFKKDFSSRDFTPTIEIIHRELAKPDTKYSKWLENLWGMVLYQQADRAGAIEKFQVALAEDPDFAAPRLSSWPGKAITRKLSTSSGTWCPTRKAKHRRRRWPQPTASGGSRWRCSATTTKPSPNLIRRPRPIRPLSMSIRAGPKF